MLRGKSNLNLTRHALGYEIGGNPSILTAGCLRPQQSHAKAAKVSGRSQRKLAVTVPSVDLAPSKFVLVRKISVLSASERRMGIRRLGRGLRTLLIVGLSLYAATHFGVRYWTYNWPEPTLPQQADAIVCLGGDQRRDMSVGPASEIRAEACTILFERGVAPVVLFTGAGHNARSAAQAMADHAMSLGLPADVIGLEERSQSTLQNAYFH